jgi:4-hydroxy-tetrahydrodipicolinate synthase
MFKGLITALITPFKDEVVDYNSLERLIESQINNGVNGLVVLGSTGESATVTLKEREEVIKRSIATVKRLGKKTPIIIGTGTNSTLTTVEYTKQAKELGADAVLVVCPYYNKPTQEGIFQHFKAVNEVGIPIIVYNNPARAVIDISDQNIAAIAELKNVVAIKDATGDLTRPVSLKQALNNNDFIQLSGEDATAVPFNLMGGAGCISIIGNILPQVFAKVQKLALEGKYKEATTESSRYFKLMRLMYCETNPIPVKYAAYRLKLIDTPEVRLPLVPLTEDSRKKIDAELKNLGLI